MDEQIFSFDHYQIGGEDKSTSNPQGTMFNDFSESFFDNLKSPDPTSLNEFFSTLTDFQTLTEPTNEISSSSLHFQNEINRDHSEPTLKFLIEPQQTSPNNYVETPRILPTNHIQLSIPLATPTITKTNEPISLTFDQFQALLNSQTDRSNGISSLLENSTIIGNNIPLKIVPSPSDDCHSTIKSTNETNSIRPRRKSSHNVIEKRYRSSINEKILELKDIVAANDGKIQKSGILRRTIEYIRQLQLTNARLEEENSTLKNILKRLNLTNIPSSNTHVIEPTSISSSTYTSESSDESTTSSSPKRKKRSQSKAGMVNGSRLMLCCFMFFILITNPFNYLLDFLHSSSTLSNNDESIGIQSRIVSRTLQTTQIDEHFKLILFGLTWKQLISSMLNMAICCVCLIKLFVHGDPIVDENEMNEYYSLKKLADEFMLKNQLNDAQRVYRQSCEKLYISIDNHFLSYFLSLTWQMIRFILNLIFVGRWLTFWSGWTKSIDTRNYHRELTLCFLQLWKIEYQCSTSRKNLFHLALLTFNTSMNSGKKLDQNLRNEIVLLSALTLKKFHRYFSILIPFVLKYFDPISTKDFQLFDVELFTEFLCENSIDLFNEKRSIRDEYFRFVLLKQIQNEFLFDDQNEIETKFDEDFNEYFWWQHVLQLIRCIRHENQHINNIYSTDQLRQEEKQTKITIYQFVRQRNVLHENYVNCVETIHRILLVLTDDDQLNEMTRRIFLEKLAEISRSLILMKETQRNSSIDHRFHLAIQTLLFDGILSLRLRLLTNSINKENPNVPYLNDFQQELDHYKILTQTMKLPKQRFYLFESIFRASSGLNPLITQTLFECAMKPSKNIAERQNIDESLPNLDIIAAILLFCHFLPSTVYHYREFLQRVVSQTTKTKKNSDLQRLQQQCLTLMRQPFLTL